MTAVRHCLIACALLTLLAAPALGQGGGPQLTQSVVAGGGGVSTQGPSRLEGTVGQGVVGTSAGGVFSLEGGFVFAVANRAPVNAAPATHATNEDTALVFGGANSVSVSDPDAGTASVQITLSAVNGTLTLGGTAGLTFAPPGADNDGTADAQTVFSGTLAAVNAALAGLTFTPTPNFHGAASLTVETNDLGHTGEGGNLLDTDTVNITVSAVNDQPSASGQSVTTDEGVPVGITLAGADAETPGGSLVFTVTAQPTHGTLSGTAPNLTYAPAAGYDGPDGFTFTVTDTGDGAAAPLTSAEATVLVTVVRAPRIVVHDARVAEPTADETQMLFTVSLNRELTSPVSVDYATSAEPDGPGKATAGSDYLTTSGTLTFQPGQRMQTVAVTVLRDKKTEPDETFLLRLSNASGGRIAGSAGTGTITAANPAGLMLISELRTFGPGPGNDPGDEFVEVYNNSGAPVTVSTTDGSPGWGLFKLGGCDATPVLVGTIPNDTVIPARGHYLFVGSAYSLDGYAAGDSTLTADIEPGAGLALFSTSDVGHLSSGSRLDAVGFGGDAANNCALFREGDHLGAPAANLTSLGQHSFFRKLCGFVNGKGCQTDGTPLDKHDNATDFTFADTTATEVVGTGQRLGAPGPQNKNSPRQTNAIAVGLLDGSKPGATAPNRVREHGDTIPGIADLGTMTIRRRVVNTTAGPVTRLRFRISEITTYPHGMGQADLRVLTSADVSVMNVGDAGTCGGPAPCNVTVEGTTLEEEPNQPNGGGLNATLTVTLGTPLAVGDDVLVQFRLGVRHSGLFRFYVITETLP